MQELTFQRQYTFTIHNRLLVYRRASTQLSPGRIFSRRFYVKSGGSRETEVFLQCTSVKKRIVLE